MDRRYPSRPALFSPGVPSGDRNGSTSTPNSAANRLSASAVAAPNPQRSSDIEIEARRDAEAFQGGAQRGNVDLGSAHDDADLAEGASGGGLLENAAGDLFDLAFDARRLDEG